MLDWLTANSGGANAVLNSAMLLVWVLYLRVFVSTYRRQRRASILIGVGGGSGLDARCLVANMSDGPIYVRSVILDIRNSVSATSHAVTEIEDLEEWTGPSDLDLWTRQGPLAGGGVRDMGTFRAMIDHALRATDRQGEAIEEVRVTVVAHYGPDDLLVAAEQAYAVEPRGSAMGLRPLQVTPRQIRSRRERKRLRSRLERGSS